MYGRFAGKNIGRNNEVAVRRGYTGTSYVGIIWNNRKSASI